MRLFLVSVTLVLASTLAGAAAGVAAKRGNHSFRAPGITAYLKNGGTLERQRR